jgi:hypothetical protein
MSFLIFVRDYLRRSRPGVQIAKAAITGEYVTQMVARLECGVLAVPVHSARPDVYYCAPRSITTSSARSSPQACYCRNDGDSSRQSCELRCDHRDYLLTQLHIHSADSTAIKSCAIALATWRYWPRCVWPHQPNDLDVGNNNYLVCMYR